MLVLQTETYTHCSYVYSSGVGAQSAAPGPSRTSWCGQWYYIYDAIVLSQPWYYLLFFEDA